MKRILILISEAAIIHPKLKIEESAIINVIFFIVIWENLPMIVLEMIPIKISGLCINISR